MPGGTYGPPVRIVAMAADGVNVFAPSQPTPVDRPGSVELWHRPRPGLWTDDCCRHPGLCLGLPRADDPRTTPRLVSGCHRQERRQTGPQTSQPRGEPLCCTPPLLDRGLDRPSLPPTRSRHGRLDPGATLHHALDQRGGPRLCHPRGLAHRRGHACRRLAPPLGSPLGPLTGQRARRLDRDCARRPWLVCPLAVYDDASPGLASLLAPLSSMPLSWARLLHLSAADAGRQPRRAAVGRPGPLLCHASAATHVHPPRALGCRVSRSLVGP